MTLTWEIISAMIAIIAFLQGIFHGWLRLWMAKIIYDLKEEMMRAIKTDFTPSNLARMQFKQIEEKIKDQEERVKRLEDRN